MRSQEKELWIAEVESHLCQELHSLELVNFSNIIRHTDLHRVAHFQVCMCHAATHRLTSVKVTDGSPASWHDFRLRLRVVYVQEERVLAYGQCLSTVVHL